MNGSSQSGEIEGSRGAEELFKNSSNKALLAEGNKPLSGQTVGCSRPVESQKQPISGLSG
jgi:hypothetical protein